MFKKIVKEIVFIATKIDESCNFYLFGSVLTNAKPNDIDLLVVYDPLLLPPEKVFSTIAPIITELEHQTDLPVHVTALTKTEEQEHNFINKSRATII